MDQVVAHHSIRSQHMSADGDVRSEPGLAAMGSHLNGAADN